MREAESSPAEGDADPAIADLSSLSLDVVLGSDDSALANSLRRLLHDMGRPGENYAAHGSTP